TGERGGGEKGGSLGGGGFFKKKKKKTRTKSGGKSGGDAVGDEDELTAWCTCGEHTRREHNDAASDGEQESAASNDECSSEQDCSDKDKAYLARQHLVAGSSPVCGELYYCSYAHPLRPFRWCVCSPW